MGCADIILDLVSTGADDAHMQNDFLLTGTCCSTHSPLPLAHATHTHARVRLLTLTITPTHKTITHQSQA